MTIGVIAAMRIEFDGIVESMKDRREECVGGLCFVSGEISGRRVVAVMCGIGKVFAAIAAEAMTIKYSPDVIINTGVAGALSDKLNIFDIVIADGAVEHDFECGCGRGVIQGLEGSLEGGVIPCDRRVVEALSRAVSELGFHSLIGKVATGDQFISDDEVKRGIKDAHGALACEMEGGAVGQVCLYNGVPYGIIRAISDGGGDDAGMLYEEFAPRAAKNSIAVTLRFIEGFEL
ncbi:MAG: 5'-methylthioadenosine/adenosylhomocysteine nucleosidase [Firmicutes bacterium]|nr:5'-methylthioadenosine/adenosylhomocysteine nucleosidase [Bacillota bacterium]